MAKAIQNVANFITMTNSTATLATHQYGFVYESAEGVISKAGSTQTAFTNSDRVFILANTPAASELATVVDMSAGGQYRVKTGGTGISLGTELMISTGGLAIAATSGKRVVAKAAEANSASGDIIVVDILQGQGIKST